MGTNAAAIRAEPIPRPAAKNASDDNFARRSARANRGDGEGGDDIVEGCGEGGKNYRCVAESPRNFIAAQVALPCGLRIVGVTSVYRRSYLSTGQRIVTAGRHPSGQK